jgi:hypothetical protein
MVLALKTSKVAPHRGNGERSRAGEEVKERLLFNRVHVCRDDPTKNQGVKLPFFVLPHPTNPPLRGGDRASMVTKRTLYFPFLQRTVKHRFLHFTFLSPRSAHLGQASGMIKQSIE